MTEFKPKPHAAIGGEPAVPHPDQAAANEEHRLQGEAKVKVVTVVPKVPSVPVANPFDPKKITEEKE
jgi:hypothetical protein